MSIPSPGAPKVLGIGLSRTGTMSLAQALGQLGYRAANFVDHREARRGESSWFAGDFDTDSLSGFDAAVDLPLPAFYPQLDARYPGSKFILTIRDPETWLVSVRRHWSVTPITDDSQGSTGAGCGWPCTVLSGSRQRGCVSCMRSTSAP